MATLNISLLAVAVLGIFVLPRRVPSWVSPVVAATLLVVVGGTTWNAAWDSLTPLLQPVAFLLFAVPMAVTLDRLGFFSSAAALVETGKHPVFALWVFAALVTTFLNLDASVVLLTPLYIHIARRHNLNVTLLAFQPVLLACLASSALPISNLTNLIVAEQAHVSLWDFLIHLGPPSFAAVLIGWIFYRRLDHSKTSGQHIADEIDKRALRIGTPIVIFAVLGFTLGELIHVAPWQVALAANLMLVLITRDVPRLRHSPFGAAALAVGLGVVATAAAPELNINRLLGDSSYLGQMQTAGFAMFGADTINNLPALLVGLPTIKDHSELLWPFLFGVNFGPIFILHGSLAGLLWHRTCSQLGVKISYWEYTKVGLKVGIPALIASFGVLLLTSTAR